jgi:hypothetical protein
VLGGGASCHGTGDRAARGWPLLDRETAAPGFGRGAGAALERDVPAVIEGTAVLKQMPATSWHPPVHGRRF